MAISWCHLVFPILFSLLAHVVLSGETPVLVSALRIRDMALPNLKLLNASIRVDPIQNPDWAGEMTAADCVKAAGFFRGRLFPFYNPDKRFTFWTAKSTSRPGGDEFELPFGVRHSEQNS